MMAIFMMCSLTVQAQDAQTIADVRCIVVGAKLAGLPDSSHRTVGTMLILYYIGRIDGRQPKLDIRHLIAQEVGKLDSQLLVHESERCQNALAAKGRQIELIGKSMVNQKHDVTSAGSGR
jgi:hypothetical protein